MGGLERGNLPHAILCRFCQYAWGVEVPDIPGYYSVGDDLDDAMAMAREAIEGHFEILAEDGAPIPSAQKVTLHAANPKYAGCMWAVVDIDVTKYLGKAQKLNITLPGYLLNRIDEYVLHHPEKKAVRGSSRPQRSRCCNRIDSRI